jgi:hypothetical protein
MAEKYGLWGSVIFEYPQRIPYLDVLVHLDAADGVFILGSTEPHYTPSKVYQGVLSGKPILAVLHRESTAVAVIRSANTGVVLDFDGEAEVQRVGEEFIGIFEQFMTYLRNFDPQQVNTGAFEPYSARSVTGALAALLDKCVK